METTKVSIAEMKLPDPKKVASVEGITEYRLENGMKVLMFPDQSQQTITVNITYLVGSRHEGYGETGMAHLLEHMVFKGSPKHPNIPAELSERGARPNGTTWLDRTNYFETFAANEDNLKWALDLESDRMVNSFIKKEDLESEFSVVRNEFEIGENDPGSVLMERIISAGYLWHNYGNSTIGSRKDIERVPIENLQAFYRKYYQPDNAVLLVAGKFDSAKTLKMINEYFGTIPRPERKLQQTYTAEPTQDGELFVELRRVGDVQYLGAMYHIVPGPHPDYAPLDILTDILTNEPSGKLYKSLVESKLASSQFGYTFELKEPGLAYFGVEVLKDKDIAPTKKAFLATLDAVPTMVFSKEEVERAKSKSLKRFELISRNSEVLGKVLSEYIAQGDWRLIYLSRDAVEKVSVEDVKRVAAYYFKPANRTYGQFIPTAEPDRVDVTEAPDVEKLVASYKGRAAVAEGEAFDPSPENIESRTIRGEAANGLEYAFLPKTTRGNTVSANITLRMGTKESLSNKGMTDNLTASMLMRGSEALSRQAVKDSLDKLKAQAFVYGGGNSVNASISTTRENLPAVIRLVADVMKNPAFDVEEFDKLKDEQKAQIESQKSDPQSLALTEFRRTMNPYPKSDVRYTPTLEESLEMLEKAKVEDLKAFHQQFYGGSNATVSVVGDFDEAEIKSIVEKEFGSWKNATPFVRIASPYQEVTPVSTAIKTPDKANAMFLAGIPMPISDSHPDYVPLMLGNYMLGGGFLNSRLATRIRQKDGLSYAVGSQLSASAQDENGTFLTYAMYAPENAAKLEIAFEEELNRVRNEGFTEEELKAARDGYLQSFQVGRSKDNELSGKLNNYLYIDRTMDYDSKMEDQIKDMTVEQINTAFRKYIDPAKAVKIKAGDFDKKPVEKTEEKSGGAGVSSDGGN
ncbi:MAG: pitrilysin family protein [Spirosomataceae bacterium]